MVNVLSFMVESSAVAPETIDIHVDMVLIECVSSERASDGINSHVLRSSHPDILM